MVVNQLESTSPFQSSGFRYVNLHPCIAWAYNAPMERLSLRVQKEFKRDIEDAKNQLKVGAVQVDSPIRLTLG